MFVLDRHDCGKKPRYRCELSLAFALPLYSDTALVIAAYEMAVPCCAVMCGAALCCAIGHHSLLSMLILFALFYADDVITDTRAGRAPAYKSGFHALRDIGVNEGVVDGLWRGTSATMVSCQSN